MGVNSTLAVERLGSLDAEVEQAASALRALIDLTILPERSQLATVRLRLSRILRAHLLHLTVDVLPALARSTADAREAAVSYRRLLDVYHMEAAHHIGRWPSDQVVLRWDTYRADAAAMLRLLATRQAAERTLLIPHLRSGARKE